MERLIICCFTLILISFKFVSGQTTNDFVKTKKIESVEDLPCTEKINERIFELLNQYRILNGKNTLAKNNKLANGACLHSSEMVKHNFFSHTNTNNKTLKTFEDRAELAGYTNNILLGENIYYSKYYFDEALTIDDIANEVIIDLANSASHNKIMLESGFKEVGICLLIKISSKDDSYECYVTQMFGVR